MVLLCLLVSPGVVTADLAEEWRTADDAAAILPQGEQVWLRAGADKFWAIYRESARKEPRGAAIILPDPALRPVASQGVQPLAASLRQFGWQVLVLQPPTSGAELFLREAASRLDAAVEFLAEKNQAHMALVGMGDAAVAALDYAGQHSLPLPPTPAELEALRQRGEQPPLPKPAVRLVALVDLPWCGKEDAAMLARRLGQVRMPMADYDHAVGGEALEEWAKQRRVAAKANEAYRQLRFGEPNPAEEGENTLFTRRLAGWMGSAMRAEVEKLPKPAANASQPPAVPPPSP